MLLPFVLQQYFEAQKQSRLALHLHEGSRRSMQDRHWVLDPIDGTRGFVGQRQYAVCLGMLDQGQVLLCVIHTLLDPSCNMMQSHYWMRDDAEIGTILAA